MNSTYRKGKGKFTIIALKGRIKNKLVEFAPGFAIDLFDLIEQNRKHNSVMLRILQLRID